MSGARAGVAEAVDARVSKTRSFGSVSSSLTARTSAQAFPRLHPCCRLCAAAAACEGEVDDRPCNARYRRRRRQRPGRPRHGPDLRVRRPPGRHDRPARGEPRRGEGEDRDEPRRLPGARPPHGARGERRPGAHPHLDRPRGRGRGATRSRGGAGGSRRPGRGVRAAGRDLRAARRLRLGQRAARQRARVQRHPPGARGRRSLLVPAAAHPPRRGLRRTGERPGRGAVALRRAAGSRKGAGDRRQGGSGLHRQPASVRDPARGLGRCGRRERRRPRRSTRWRRPPSGGASRSPDP